MSVDLLKDVPKGYVPLNQEGYVDYVGPLYWRSEPIPSLLMRVANRHLNGGSFIHGGMLMTLAETVCRQTLLSSLSGRKATLLSLNTDFITGAMEGNMIEGKGNITRMSKSVAFVSGELQANERVLLTASALYSLQD